MKHAIAGTSLAALALLGAPLSAAAQEGGQVAAEAETGWSQAAGDLAAGLAELAEWCHAERLYLQRDLTYEHLLHFEPAHAEARRFLKYHKGDDGSWSQEESYRRPKDRDKGALPELVTRRAKLMEKFRLDVATWVEEREGSLSRARLQDVWSTLIVLDPDDDWARSMRGEVKDAERECWVLTETASTAKVRRSLRAFLTELRAEGREPERDELSEQELALGLPLVAAVRTEHVRVLGTCPEAELSACARLAEESLALFLEACDPRGRLPELLTIHLLDGEAQRDQLFASHPGLAGVDPLEARGYESHWVPSHNELVVWSRSEAVRSDQSARGAIALMLRLQYGIDHRQGWIFEGVCEFLAELATGTTQSTFDEPAPARRTPIRRPDGPPDGLGSERRESAGASSANAPSEGLLRRVHAQLATSGGPALAEVLSKRAPEMDGVDRLLGYGMVRFLLEGRPRLADQIFRLAGRGMEAQAALERVLAHDLGVFEERLVRWLTEIE